MYVGMIVLVVLAILVLFGIGQRVLDKLRLTDRQALLFMGLTIVGGFLPEIPLGDRVRFNIGGFLVPLGLCVYLFLKAEGGKEIGRAIAAAALSGAAVWLIGAYFPNEPETMPFDVNYLYGIAAGVIACILGRSRRSAFIGGVLGVILADIAQAVVNWANGVDQTLVLGGAGAFDTIVLSGVIAVLLRELVGEIHERASRKTGEPERTVEGGDITPQVLGANREEEGDGEAVFEAGEQPEKTREGDIDGMPESDGEGGAGVEPSAAPGGRMDGLPETDGEEEQANE